MQEIPASGGLPTGFFANRRRWQVALLLSLVTAIGSIDRQAMAVTAARLKEAFELDAVHYGQLGFAFLGAYAVGQLLSGPFVARLGTRLALDKKPWLPERLLRRELSGHALAKLLGATSQIMRGIEYFLQPRFGFVPNHAVFGRIAGFLIALSGLMLMLPLPLPFSNSLPAWTVLFLAAGALGRDGLFFFAGCASFALSVAFFAFVAFGGMAAFDNLWRLVGGGS